MVRMACVLAQEAQAMQIVMEHHPMQRMKVEKRGGIYDPNRL